jgi:antitoxin component YwqK of YwqJK toxin-antitoxin module
MKKALLFVLVLIAVGCAEPIPRNLEDLSMQGPQYLDPETLEPYSGPAYRTSEYDSTQIVLRVNLRDGRFHGDFEDFEIEGAADSLGLYETGTYRDGQREGRYEYFYPSGVLRGRGTYENGLEEGPYESYYENGEPRNKVNYTDGKENGPIEVYHENGQLSWKYTYVAGKMDGPFEAYHENGQLWEKGTYVAGEPCGEWTIEGEAQTYPKPC